MRSPKYVRSLTKPEILILRLTNNNNPPLLRPLSDISAGK